MFNDIDEIGLKLSNLKAPEHWKKDGVKDPSEEACVKAIELICDIFEKIDEFPVVIAPTVENGVYISYIRKNISLSIEIYNEDLAVACIISDGDKRKILFCKDIVGNELEEALHTYEMESQKII
jgi:hypothetical protein